MIYAIKNYIILRTPMPPNKDDQSQFHSSEIMVQKRLGVYKDVAKISKGLIRKAMPQQHRDFFSELPFVIFGFVDTQGRPWAIPIFNDNNLNNDSGEGTNNEKHEAVDTTFVSSPNDTTLKIKALPKLHNLLQLDFTQGQKVGVLGLQLETRRRNRMNGLIGDINDHEFTIDVEQSFGNCPQYIQTRELTWQTNIAKRTNFNDVNIVNDIDESSKSLLENTDTFFIASRTHTFSHDSKSGIDVSHRGGKPGFVKVEGNTLYFPDFSGNKFFNTLGNIESDNRVGLLFIDFSTGDSIFITGKAKILWDSRETDTVKGAERIVKICAEKILNISKFTTLRGELIEYSPTLYNTGTWNASKLQKKPEYQPLKIIRKQHESETITSFYLAPVPSMRPEENNISVIDNYTPGQFLPIQLHPSNNLNSTPVSRMYTLSRAPTPDAYRISVKREKDGVASKSLHDDFKVGDTINAGKPSGMFTLRKNNCAVVLVSMGVGITPMIAILEGIIDDINRGDRSYPVWFIHGTQNNDSFAFKTYLSRVERKYSWLKIHIAFSRPQVNDSIGQDYQSQGRVSIELLKNILPFDPYRFYLCGSAHFMRDIYSGLRKSRVDTSNIFYEFFGDGEIEDTITIDPKKAANKAKICFSKSNISNEWTLDDGSLLAFSERLGLTPIFGCRSGNCGACACKLISGEVTYLSPPNAERKENEILICCALPAEGSSNIVIDI